MFTFGLLCFTSFFTLINPLGAMPVFMTMTMELDEKERRKVARRASLVSFLIMMFFAISGDLLFRFFGISIERRAHSFAIAALNPSDDGDWVSAYATTSVRSFSLDDPHPPGWVSMIAQCLPVTLPGITLCFTGGLLDRPIELGGSFVDAVCHFDPPSLSYKERFLFSP